MSNETNTPQVVAFWQKFIAENNLPANLSYSAWSFGNDSQMADDLLALVLANKKHATSSYYDLYVVSGEALPQEDQYNVLLDGAGVAKAIIKNRFVECLPFSQVTKAHAYLEGEGNQTLEYWRNVHRPFFMEEANQFGLNFAESSLVVVEIFDLVYVTA